MTSVNGRIDFWCSAAEVVSSFGGDPIHGLAQAEVDDRRRRYGPNKLTPKRSKGPIRRFLLQFHAPLVYILMAAGATTAALGVYIDATVIFGVVLVNAVVGFIQEAKALTSIDSLAKVLSRTSMVIRDGTQQVIPAEQLVPGDIVLLQSGDKVPADVRFLHIRDLFVDESALTGESMPVAKDTGPLPEDTVLADRRNMAYASSLVTYGTATGIVVATGPVTEVGRISGMIASAEILETPLTKRIARFSNILLIVILVLAALTFGIGVLRDQPWLQTLLAAVALAVGAIPEGLPAAVTIMLAIGMSRMARRRAIIRKLPAVETLGSTTVICTDKTGTLTHNQMTVREIAAGGSAYRLTGKGYAPFGEILCDGDGDGDGNIDNVALNETLICGALCNDTTLRVVDDRWQADGDPTEGALLASALKAAVDSADLGKRFPRLDAIPFESAYQFMATLHPREENPRSGRIYLKGAVEQVLSRCGTALGPRGESVLVEASLLKEIADELARKGRRVLAFARKDRPPGLNRTLAHADVMDGLVFLGFQAMFDPPREEAASAVASCRRAGIQVKMITGDHAVTAEAVAAEIGIIDAGEQETAQRVTTGRELDAMDDETLSNMAETSNVFARVTPEAKLKLVRALQKRGHVVAMTGDGVNDAPAVRAADIGVAMALGRTEVAREAADMVLTDDNFATIEAAVREGRGVFDNLVKFITWTLPTNIGEGLVLLVAVVLGTDLPLRPVQALWINMTTVVTLGTMLAFEPADEDIMTRPPRNPNGALIAKGILFHIAFVSALICLGAFVIFWWESSLGSTLRVAQTATAGFIVLSDIFYLLSCRSFHKFFLATSPRVNPWIWLGIAAMILLQLAFTFLPAMNEFFHTAPLPQDTSGRIALVCAAFVLLVEIVKRFNSGAPKQFNQN